MSVSIKEENYSNYGKCLNMTNGRLTLKVTLDVGPRIIYASLDGDGNVFFNDTQRVSNVGGEKMDRVFGKGSVWYIYGGTRMWFSPEEMPLTYYPDNEPVAYAADGGSVAFTPPVQRVTGFAQSITVTLDPELPKASVKYSATNKSGAPHEYAIWALSVCAPGGMAIVPQPKEDTVLLANRVLSVWPYTDMSDRRVMFGKDHIALRQLPEKGISPFKYGINNTAGVAAYVHGATLFVKRYAHSHPDGAYPDFGVSTEVYTNERMLELETLGTLHTYAPGETFSHTEDWEFVSGVEMPDLTPDSVAAFAQKYLS